MKPCTPAEREQILADLQKGGFKVAVSTNQALAMKADLKGPWTATDIDSSNSPSQHTPDNSIHVATGWWDNIKERQKEWNGTNI